jgi:hypothetical protein
LKQEFPGAPISGARSVAMELYSGCGAEKPGYDTRSFIREGGQTMKPILFY